MNIISTQCPQCNFPLNVRIDSLEPGSHNKSYICEKCWEVVIFEYKLGLEKAKTFYRDPIWMRKKYLEEGQTMKQIADICGCTPMTIRDWLIRHDIQTRNRGEKGNKN